MLKEREGKTGLAICAFLMDLKFSAYSPWRVEFSEEGLGDQPVANQLD
jgi:hypothetical protein